METVNFDFAVGEACTCYEVPIGDHIQIITCAGIPWIYDRRLGLFYNLEAHCPRKEIVLPL